MALAPGVNVTAGNAVKICVCAFTQPGLLRTIGATRAPGGTVAVMLVLLSGVKAAATSPNLTAVTPARPVPVIVTGLPTAPLLALNPATSRQPVWQQAKPV